MVMLMVEMMMLALVQYDGDGASQYRDEGEEAHPGTTTRHESFSLVEFLFLYVQIFLYPLHLSESSHAIIKQ